MNPIGPIEQFLVAVLEQLRARAAPSEVGMECQARPALDLVRETARAAAEALAKVEAPLLALARHLEDVLDAEASTLGPSERARNCSSTATRNCSTGPIGFTSPLGGAMRPDQLSPGRAAAARVASASAALAST